jgi:tubulin-specific chaperone D
MDDDPEDARDLEFQKAAPVIVHEIVELVERSLWKSPKEKYAQLLLHRFFRRRDLEVLVLKIDIFQENPQLLDTKLQHLVAQLASAYLQLLEAPQPKSDRSDIIPTSAAICKILYMLSKVRGDKVIVRLLNNEPKYLEPMIQAVERISTELATSDFDDLLIVKPWEERYILFLWLSHLLLAPFDLATISSAEYFEQLPLESSLILPTHLPSIAKRIVALCGTYIGAATREQIGAASLLVRVCIRPDMRKIGLHECVMQWLMGKLKESTESTVESFHRGLGCLKFFNRLVSAGSPDEIGDLLLEIYETCQLVLADERFQSLHSSAIALKLIIKIFRNIAIKSLHTEIVGLEPDLLLSELIEFLLQSLSNSDSVVRISASKSLSLITQQLDANTSEDVIDAILESFKENIIYKDKVVDFSAVNALLWHGLTLTLSHLLYRRAVSPDRLPDVLATLFLALSFEQRSVTGSSVGTNVRDAANFGIWAIARRYRTEELLKVETRVFDASEAHVHATSVIQILAVELIKSACLDPAGNVRRGSSAALQELIGRHPQTVREGIALTQTVDYHVVALLRNSIKAAASVASLDALYWYGVLDACMGWRGIGSNEENTRNLLKEASFLLSGKNRPLSNVAMLERVSLRIRKLPKHDLEEWHGLVRMASGILRRIRLAGPNEKESSSLLQYAENPRMIVPTEKQTYLSRSTRSLSLSIATLDWIYELCNAIKALPPTTRRFGSLIDCMEYCLRRFEGEELDSQYWALELANSQYEIPSTYNVVLSIVAFDDSFIARARSWILEISQSGHQNRSPGLVLGLGACYGYLQDHNFIMDHTIDILAGRCTTNVEVDARVTALTSIRFVVDSFEIDLEQSNELALPGIVKGVLAGLTDYTITERGDVGSKVRIAALRTLRRLIETQTLPEDLKTDLATTAIPLCLEKLDRVREAAWAIKFPKIYLPIWDDAPAKNISPSSAVLTQEYFADWLMQLRSPISERIKQSVVQGFCSCAGGGSESVLRAARNGFLMFVQNVLASNRLLIVTAFLCYCRQALQENLKTDRIVLPVLQTLAYIGDLGFFKVLENETSIK